MKRSLLLILTPLLLLAEDGDHKSIGTRPAPTTEEQATVGFIFDRYPPVYYSASHHWLTAITRLDNDDFTIRLEDGSVWRVSYYDGMKAQNWKTNDPLTLTQNSRWFSKHNFRIINKNTGSYLEATMHQGPIENGPHSLYITSINFHDGTITLNDYTNWEAASSDMEAFSKWRVNDYVILGTNSDSSFWDLDKPEALLINFDTLKAVRFKQF